MSDLVEIILWTAAMVIICAFTPMLFLGIIFPLFELVLTKIWQAIYWVIK